MEYRPQIIASDLDGLQVISACSMGAKIRVADIKYLLSNKVFLLSIAVSYTHLTLPTILLV